MNLSLLQSSQVILSTTKNSPFNLDHTKMNEVKKQMFDSAFTSHFHKKAFPKIVRSHNNSPINKRNENGKVVKKN